jgi:succinate-semialdehyde dehydrogenase/glutarate-semialdehyde dehydrogenase
MPSPEPPTAPSYPSPGLLINGEWIRGGRETIPVVNPADEAHLAQLPIATAADLDAALAAAERGLRVWRATGPNERAAVMLKAAALLRQRVDAIAPRITLELGKTLDEARYEVLRAADILSWDAGEGQRCYGRINPSRPGWRHMVLRQPIGVVAAFTPWNAPIGSPARKISAALAAGCAMVIKPSEETPASACALAECLQDAGLPPGVLNIVFGRPDEISRHLIASPIVRLVTFTGSVAVGKHLAQLAGTHMKATLMELGGHAAVLVCGDADPKAVARLAVTAKFRMGGQVCVSPTRFLVQRNIYAAFVDAFAGGAAALRVGPGLEQGSQMGALVNGRRLQAMQSLVDDAVRCGARVATGGKRVGDRGYFFQPTVLADVPASANALVEEPFGPLALVMPFDELSDAIRTANQLQVGLAGYAFTNSLATAERLADELESGLLSINHFGAAAPDMPFGGVKDSGFGREGGAESLDSYTITKMVSVRSAVE